MSSFQCSDKHISTIAQYFINEHLDRAYSCEVVLSAQDVGEILHNENVQSVDNQYKDKVKNDIDFPFKLDRSVTSITFNPNHLLIIKACHCLAYQSSESIGWKNSEACKIIRMVESHAIQNLSGYEELPWEIL